MFHNQNARHFKKKKYGPEEGWRVVEMEVCIDNDAGNKSGLEEKKTAGASGYWSLHQAERATKGWSKTG